MKTVWPKIALLVLCCGVLWFELWHVRGGSTPSVRNTGPAPASHKGDFALLPADQIGEWAKNFGGDSHAESWEPTLGDMNDAEGALVQLAELSRSAPEAAGRIENPGDYYRQYLAVMVDGRKKMFLNAFCSIDQNADWRKRLIVARDGGRCFWHAMYDPATQRYSDQMVNGKG